MRNILHRVSPIAYSIAYNTVFPISGFLFCMFLVGYFYHMGIVATYQIPCGYCIRVPIIDLFMFGWVRNSRITYQSHCGFPRMMLLSAGSVVSDRVCLATGQPFNFKGHIFRISGFLISMCCIDGSFMIVV